MIVYVRVSLSWFVCVFVCERQRFEFWRSFYVESFFSLSRKPSIFRCFSNLLCSYYSLFKCNAYTFSNIEPVMMNDTAVLFQYVKFIHLCKMMCNFQRSNVNTESAQWHSLYEIYINNIISSVRKKSSDDVWFFLFILFMLPSWKSLWLLSVNRKVKWKINENETENLAVCVIKQCV